jgi:hypothetical protein
VSDPRLPDRGDVLTRDGQQWTVIDLTNRHVRLLGDMGTRDVPVWEWPQGFQPLGGQESESGEAPRIKALLIGGAAGKHLDRIEKIADDQGVDIAAHWPSNTRKLPSQRIPVHIDLVIWLTSHIDHSTYYATKSMAESQGLPTAHVPSQGFGPNLAKELARLGLRRSEYGVLVAEPSQGRYEWTGSTWTWREVGDEPVDRSTVGPIVQAPDGLVAGVLVLGGLLAMGRSR